MVGDKVSVTIVLNKGPDAKRRPVRCVYMNDYRVVGGKPYVSEDLPHAHFEMSLGDLRAAFIGELDIQPNGSATAPADGDKGAASK